MSHPLLLSTLDLMSSLVAFDTRSRNSNLELIAFVQDYLKQFGVGSSLTHDESGLKANLYATIGATERRGLCLSGHTDVVPTEGQPWTVPPFELTLREGRALGRGTADMKGFIAAVLASVPHFVANCGEVPIHLSFSYDEEVGCRGVPGLLRELASSPFKPLACIVGEPTLMRLAIAHKGKRGYRCSVTGLAGHSALTHLGANAVEFAAELVTFLRRTASDLRSHGERDERFTPPYSTVHTGRLNGGIALNVIPDHAELEFEIRNLPDDNPDKIVDAIRAFADVRLVQEMRRVSPDAGIAWETLSSYPALRDEPEARWLQVLAGDLTGAGRREALSFGSEAGLFQAIGIPSVVCGPGSIEQGHKADEYVELQQLSQCLAFLERLCAGLPEAVRAIATDARLSSEMPRP